MNMPIRKHHRLKQYDYRSVGAYFITICSAKHEALFGSIYGDPPENHLTAYGKAVESEIIKFNRRYAYLKISNYVVMPNHIHLLMELNDDTPIDARVPIPHLVGMIKSLTTRACKKIGFKGESLYQPSFHEHIVRSEQDYQMIWEYIDCNPIRWAEDRYYV